MNRVDADADADADDLFVDHCLEQELGGHRPPDHAARIAAAGAVTLAHAAARVDAALPLAQRRAVRVSLAIAAALVITAAVSLAVEILSHDEERSDRAALALLDMFHLVMPKDPATLRDEPRRRDLAGTALPVLRQIIAYHAAHPDEQTFGKRIVEFEVYAAAIGDADVLRSIEQRAAAGDDTAAMQLAVTALITAGDTEQREGSLATLGEHLPRHPESAGSLVQCLLAGELTTTEAEQLVANLVDADLARYLLQAAERTATSPRRLLGQPIELFGTLSDDRRFTTSSLRGRIVLVCFWATWCRPSLTTMAELSRIRELHPELAVVGVSCDHDHRALRDYLAEHPAVDWPQLFDRARPGWHALAFSSGVHVLPFVMLIDRQGVVREVDVGRDIDAAVRRHRD